MTPVWVAGSILRPWAASRSRGWSERSRKQTVPVCLSTFTFMRGVAKVKAWPSSWGFHRTVAGLVMTARLLRAGNSAAAA